MNKQWFYFDNYIYINIISPNKVLVYNTLNKDLLTYYNNEIFSFVKELKSEKNNGIIEVDLQILQKSKNIIYDFIIETRRRYMSDLLPITENRKKPILFQSEPMLLREGHAYYNYGDSILQNITELTFYINEECSFNCELCNKYHKQISSCYKSNRKKELSVKQICSCLNNLQEASLIKVSLIGGNILLYSDLDNLIQELNEYSFNKTYKINTKHITDIRKLYPILENSKNTIEFLCTDLSEIAKINHLCNELKSPNIEVDFIIQSIADLNIVECIDQEREFNINLIPFYNNNYSFFKENVFVSQDEIKNITFKNIKRNSLLNNFFFGSLYCMPDGNIYSSLNGGYLGNIENESIISMVFKELEEKNNWLLVRKNVEPCNKCLFASMCPPLSNYEKVIGKNNLCTIHE